MCKKSFAVYINVKQYYTENQIIPPNTINLKLELSDQTPTDIIDEDELEDIIIKHLQKSMTKEKFRKKLNKLALA